jgi:hypothetical protein
MRDAQIVGLTPSGTPDQKATIEAAEVAFDRWMNEAHTAEEAARASAQAGPRAGSPMREDEAPAASPAPSIALSKSSRSQSRVEVIINNGRKVGELDAHYPR